MTLDDRFLFEFKKIDEDSVINSKFTVRKSLVRYNGNEEHVSIPEHIEGIEMHAFEGNEHLISVSVECKEPKFGFGAFRNCKKLEKVKWKNCKYISSECFDGCINLKEIGDMKDVMSIREWAFADCTSLKYIHISEHTHSIAPTAFSKSGIENIEIDNENLFYRYKNGFLIENIPDELIWVNHNVWSEEIEIPEGICCIGEYAFDSFKRIQKIIIPRCVEMIKNTDSRLLKAKIVCDKDSHAHKYAEAYGCDYEFINE